MPLDPSEQNTSAESADFEQHEREEIDRKSPISTTAIFEVIRRSGQEELNRPVGALMLSGLVAGVALGFSVLTEAHLHARLPDTEWRPLVENLGYTVGFLIVILGQMQLFTENTITAVCPALDSPSRQLFACLARLWLVVFACNLVGATIFGLALWASAPYQPDIWSAVLSLSHHMAEPGFMETLWRGVGAGWLIAALVWMMSASSGPSVSLIFIITYLIALADFSHVIAGTTEVAALVFAGEMTVSGAAIGFILPAFLGNVLGGTVLFTLLTWGQIKADLNHRNRDFSRTD